MANTVPFKIYLEEADGSIEIRRFCVDRHVFMSGMLSFDEVRDKIIKLYPSLLDRQFTIHWKDDEEDNIAVNCDDEFSIAITTIKKSWMGDMTVRLYVILDNIQQAVSVETSTEEEGTAAKVIRYTPEELKSMNTPHRTANNDSDSSSSSEKEGAAIADASPNLGQPRPTSTLFSPGSLAGLVCHLCQCSLDGRLLYKCVTCPSYNLCANCVTHAHYEHAMLRIPSQQALSRSGIFVVDRLNDLARRQSVTSRFDFSALILPIADNYEASPFRKMRDAVEVKTATKSGCGSASSTASVSRKMTRVSLPGCDASPVGVSYRPTVSDGGEGAAKGKEEQKEKEKKCKKEKKEEKKREKKERKEKKLKRSRSCRVERDDLDVLQLFDEIMTSLIVARPSLRDDQSGYGISTDLIKQILNRMDDVQPGSRRADVASGIVSDLLSSLNICSSSGASSSSETEESQPKRETRKRKVCDSKSHASKVAADNSGAAKVAVDNMGAAKVAADNSGAAKVAVDNMGAAKVAVDNSGAVKMAADNSGAAKVAVDNSGALKVADVNSSAAKVAGNNSLLAEKPFPTLTQVRFEDDGIRVTAVPEERLEEVVTSCSSPSADELDWMFVGPKPTGAIPKQTSPSVYPSPSQIPQMEPTVAPPPPQPTVTAALGQKAPLTEKQERVHSALNKMLAMGFSNEGGWLENILDQQDASIERVLEMLLPPSVVGRVVD
ncbi:uncharacterized protein LOC120350657 isoform X2 [Nilaparvata lugens]|uniref:uncharacterized protein LOC120350657 isoform X2 n=1 Tax=Nilaparvata lugens TaxID=108931 RepID=UPI00193E0FA2|nr:uncharacterized protein LOC120350657 isoform X2 [Nilaparvata lugens]